MAQCGEVAGDGSLPVIRLQTCATPTPLSLLTVREPVHVVSQRLGHANPNVTPSVYAHMMPGSQWEAADQFASFVRGSLGVNSAVSGNIRSRTSARSGIWRCLFG